LAVAVFYAPALGTARQDALELKPHAVVQHKPIDEMSGIARSRTYDGVYWVHNDSGDRARIFPIRLDGSVVIPPFVSRRDTSDRPEDPSVVYEGIHIEGAVNIDWEDIAIDGDTLYIADVGNNGNARRDLAVYVVKEPNPEATLQAHALKRIPIAYPDQKAFPDEKWHFDCEAVFVFRGKLYFITKHRAPRQIEHPRTKRDSVSAGHDAHRPRELPDTGGLARGFGRLGHGGGNVARRARACRAVPSPAAGNLAVRTPRARRPILLARQGATHPHPKRQAVRSHRVD
jgi:hypothetical protein